MNRRSGRRTPSRPLLSRRILPFLLLSCPLLSGLAGCGPVLVHPTDPALVSRDAARFRDAFYRLGPGDRIDVHHLVDPNYDSTVTIQPDGRVTLPGLAREVTAAGLTPDELVAVLVARYRDEAGIRRPMLTVLLRSSAATAVFVGGEVMRPGMLDLPGGPRRIVPVLMSAGWLLPTARAREVIVLRTGLDGTPMIFSVDLRRVESGADLAQDVLVRAGDAVLVPRSDVASFDRWMDQYVRQALPTSTSAGVFYQFNNPASAAQGLVK